MKHRAIRGMAAISAIGSAPGPSTAEPTASSTLELIGATEIPFGTHFQGYPIGGLSGLDRLPDGDFIAIFDDKGDGRPPRFYRLAITLNPPRHRVRVRMKGQVILRDGQDVPFPIDRPAVDPEAIRHGADGHGYWSSEGTWNDDPARRVQPAIYESDATGRVLRSFSLPAAYLYTDNKTRGAVSNGVLEGLAAGPNGTVDAINEVPAYEDGVADGGAGSGRRGPKPEPSPVSERCRAGCSRRFPSTASAIRHAGRRPSRVVRAAGPRRRRAGQCRCGPARPAGRGR